MTQEYEEEYEIEEIEGEEPEDSLEDIFEGPETTDVSDLVNVSQSDLFGGPPRKKVIKKKKPAIRYITPPGVYGVRQ